MELSRFITIVIPCKNESKIIDKTLTLLNFQKNINNVRVIVSDSSDDGTTYGLEIRNRDYFNLMIIHFVKHSLTVALACLFVVVVA